MWNITALQAGFQVATMSLGPIDTNAHILFALGKALIVDAPIDSLPTISGFLAAQRLEPQALLLTHGHWDHMGGAADLGKHYRLEVWGSVHDGLLFAKPQIMRAFAGDRELQPVAINHPLHAQFGSSSENMSQPVVLEGWNDLEIQALAMPGHTPGGTAYYFCGAGCVMSGDQLFAGAVGRSDLPGGDFSLLCASIRRSLYSLPAQTVVFPGHGPPTTISQEMQHNPFVRTS